MVSRIPKTPEEWAEQVSFRRNRHQFARRIGVNVVDFVLSKINELEGFFLRFPRDVYGTLLSIHELNTKVFMAARDMEKMLLRRLNKITSEFRDRQKAFRTKIDATKQRLIAYEKHTDMQIALDYVDDLELLGESIELLMEEREVLLFHQNQLEIDIEPPDKFLQLDTVCHEHKVFTTLWKICGEWSVYGENWIHGDYNQVNTAEVKETITQRTPQIHCLLDEPLKEKKSPRSVANRLRLLLYGFHVPASKTTPRNATPTLANDRPAPGDVSTSIGSKS